MRPSNLITLLLFSLLTGHSASANTDKPNIVVIFNDDMGYADLGCFGAEKIKTPRIDQMAKEGRKFTSFYVASSVCSASRAALLTGCYPNRVGVPGVFFPNRGSYGLDPKHFTIAELLKGAGYKTLAAGKWHLGDEPKFLPTNQGFDTFYGVPYSNDMYPARSMAYADNCLFREGVTAQSLKETFARTPEGQQPRALKDKVPLMRDEACIEFPLDQSTITRRLVDESIRFIGESVKAKTPFFVYLTNPMPHTPLFVSKDFEGTSAGGIYGDVIEEIDFNTGRLLDALKAQGVDENTLVIFTSDNGPWLIKKDHGGSAKPLRDGKGSTYEGGQRVPCVMRWPGNIPAGTESDEVATAMDLLPTFAELTSTPLPSDLRFKPDGFDITKLILGEPKARSPYTRFYYSNNRAVRSGDWKYREGRRYGNWSGVDKSLENPSEKQLFNLAEDIGESRNQFDQHPEVAARLKELMAQSPNVSMVLHDTRPPAGTRYELEAGEVSGKANAGNRHVGNMQIRGATVSISVDGSKGGEARAILGYASAGNSGFDLLVNGEAQAPLNLPKTGDWNTSRAAHLFLQLKPGKNTISFRSRGRGGANLDYLEILSKPVFSSELFPSGTLIYADDFDGELNRERWGAPTKEKQVKDGTLVVGPKFTSKEEAMTLLKRDHHLGLEPVAHLNQIPEKFVCHLRYKFEKPELTPGRPSFQIGHHMIQLGHLEGGGHRIKLPNDGPTFPEPDSGMKLGEWVDLIIEYKKGTLRISVDGHSKTYKHDKVTIENPKAKNGARFTFKGGPDCTIVFDSVALWDCTP